MVISGEGGRLNDEHVLAADVFLDFNEDFEIGEAPHHRLCRRHVEIRTDRLGKWPIAVAAQNFHPGRRPCLSAGGLYQQLGRQAVYQRSFLTRSKMPVAAASAA